MDDEMHVTGLHHSNSLTKGLRTPHHAAICIPHPLHPNLSLSVARIAMAVEGTVASPMKKYETASPPCRAQVM